MKRRVPTGSLTMSMVPTVFEQTFKLEQLVLDLVVQKVIRLDVLLHLQELHLRKLFQFSISNVGQSPREHFPIVAVLPVLYFEKTRIGGLRRGVGLPRENVHPASAKLSQLGSHVLRVIASILD